MRMLKFVIFLIPFNFCAGENQVISYASDTAKKYNKVTLNRATVVEVMRQRCEGCTVFSAHDKMIKPFPLMMAVKDNTPEVFSELLQHSSADLNKKDEEGFVSLFYAMKGIHEYSLGKNGEFFNQCSEENKKQFIKLLDNYEEIANMIINHRDFDQKKSGYTEKDFYSGIESLPTYPLDWVVKFRYFKVAQTLLNRHDVIYSYKFSENFAPHAKALGKEICDILMKKEPNFLQKVVVHSIVAFGGQISQGLQFLLDNYTIDKSILSRALYHAVKKSNAYDAELLVEKGATGNHHGDGDDDDEIGDTMLTVYTMGEHYDAKYLCEKIFPLIQGKNVCDPQEQKNKDGNTPFHVLFNTWSLGLYGDTDESNWAHALIKLKIDPKKVNNKEQTPLHVFAQRCDGNYQKSDGYGRKIYTDVWSKAAQKCFALSKEIGIDKEIRDKEGKKAEDYMPQCLKNCFDDDYKVAVEISKDTGSGNDFGSSCETDDGCKVIIETSDDEDSADTIFDSVVKTDDGGSESSDDELEYV
ncbi:MAG TPA: hypothetical protein VEK38_03015 [Candidatus Bathyarchaeia archaeon]|nr:hypothetical protein [Candidatus Bathyarchaeia archaeon]